MTYHIVATEGATVDGRNISAVHLEQMAKFQLTAARRRLRAS